jgi:hypothetical protein
VDKVDIRVRNVSDSPVGVLIASGVAGNLGTYSWTISSANYSSRNDYEVSISGVVNGQVIADDSDNYFSIVSIGVPDLTVDDIYYDTSNSAYIKVNALVHMICST